jgi:hypothetical protein
MITMPKLKSTKVADILEAHIMRAKPEGQQRMPTLRSLAEQFSVSRQVIESAFAILEDRQVIVRRGRQGVWVNQKLFADGVKRILIVFFGTNEIDSFQRRVLGITSDPAQTMAHCMITYKIFPVIQNNYSAFLREVNMLRNMADIDCLCVGADPLVMEQIDILRGLDIPLIFLGDFKTEELNNLPVNQVTIDNAAVIDVVLEFCGRKGYGDIAVFSRLSSLYNHGIVNSKIAEYCRDHEIYHRYYERKSENEFTSSDEVVHFYRDAIADMQKSSLPDVLILSGLGRGDVVLNELARAGISVPDDIHVISTNSESYLSGITCIHIDMHKFYNSLYEKINIVCEKNNNPEVARLGLDTVMIEMTSTEGRGIASTERNKYGTRECGIVEFTVE